MVWLSWWPVLMQVDGTEQECGKYTVLLKSSLDVTHQMRQHRRFDSSCG
jgi:hypothetical protein